MSEQMTGEEMFGGMSGGLRGMYRSNAGFKVSTRSGYNSCQPR